MGKVATPATPCARRYRWATRCWTSSSAAPPSAPTKTVRLQLLLLPAATHATSLIWANRRRRTRAKRPLLCHHRPPRPGRAGASRSGGPCHDPIRICPTWAGRAGAATAAPPGGPFVTSKTNPTFEPFWVEHGLTDALNCISDLDGNLTTEIFWNMKYFVRNSWSDWFNDVQIARNGAQSSICNQSSNKINS